jgi:hypothetical protein
MRDAVSPHNIETAAGERHPRCVDEGAAVKRWSFSTLQAVVGLIAGVTSIVGAAYSAVDTLKSAPAPGEIVVIVRDAAAQPVAAPVVEVLGADNAIVTTIIPGEDGVARRALVPGAYRIRVVHPDFREVERAVQVTPDTTTDLTLVLERKPHAIATTTPPPSPAKVASTATARPARAPARRGNPVDDAAESAHRGISAGRRFLSRLGF